MHEKSVIANTKGMRLSYNNRYIKWQAGAQKILYESAKYG